MEVEEMIKKVREKQGRPMNVRQLMTLCMGNVMMSMLFSHRFDHSDPAFKQLVSDNHDGGTNFSMALELFPALRILPYFKKLIAKELSIVKSVMRFYRQQRCCLFTGLQQQFKFCQFVLFFL